MELTIANQHSATGKTATTLGLARALAELGKRVLIVDLDPKSGVTVTLKLAPQVVFCDSLFRNFSFEDCVTRIRENLDVICSDLTTYVAEERLKRESSPQTVFEYAFAEVDDKYDVVLFDTAPEISRLQVAAFCYTHRVMVPVTLDVLGLMGACSAVFSAQALRWVYSTAIEMIGFLPTMVQRGVPETEAMLKTLAAISKKAKIEVLPSIEYDDAVLLATRGQQFVADYSATSSAAMSFELLAKKFMALEELQRKQ